MYIVQGLHCEYMNAHGRKRYRVDVIFIKKSFFKLFLLCGPSRGSYNGKDLVYVLMKHAVYNRCAEETVLLFGEHTIRNSEILSLVYLFKFIFHIFDTESFFFIHSLLTFYSFIID